MHPTRARHQVPAPLRPPRWSRRAAAVLAAAVLTMNGSATALASAERPSRIGPGAPDLRLDALQTFEAVYTDLRGDAEGRRVHRLERLTATARPALRFTISMHGRGIVEDELTLDAKTGAPLARRIFAPSLLHRVETWQENTLHWSDIGIDGSGAQTHAKEFATLPLTLPPELLIPALNLEIGDRRFVPSFSTDLGPDAPGFLLDVEVEGEETIYTPAGSFECLRVRTQMRALPSDLGAAADGTAAPLAVPARTLWLHSEAPYLIRASAQMEGLELTQELEEVRWLGPKPEALRARPQADDATAADPRRPMSSDGNDGAHGLLHRLVDWFHGLHGHAP